MAESNLLQDIDNAIDYQAFYAQFVDGIEEVGDSQFRCKCCFHEDSKPSMAFNTETGQWNCYAGCGSGNAVDFVKKHTDIEVKTSKEAVQYLCNFAGIEFRDTGGRIVGQIDDNIWQKYHEDLLGNAVLLGEIREQRGLTLETVKKYKLGVRGKRVTIPIFDSKGVCRNVRYYAFPEKSDNKMLNHRDDTEKTYGQMRLYPIENMTKQRILLVEGEMDAILANQLGMNAITVTSGAGNFNKQWVPYFKDKKVYICYDVDAAGDKGARKVAQTLSGWPQWIKLVHLREILGTDHKGADLTDFFLTYNHSIDEYRELLEQADKYGTSVTDERGRGIMEVDKTKLTPTTVVKAAHSDMVGTAVEFRAMVAGKDSEMWAVPNKLKCGCDKAASDKVCAICPLFYRQDEYVEMELSEVYQGGGLLDLIDIADRTLKSKIKHFAQVPEQCNNFRFTIEEFMNVEELRVIPEVDYSADDADFEFIRKVVYRVGKNLNTKSNAIYTMRGVTIPFPKTQAATVYVWDAEPAVDNIDQFEMTDEIHEDLKALQPDENTVEKVKAQYDKKYADIEKVSGIYKRDDIALLYDITLHSPLSVFFQGRIQRGWMEGLVIGDSGCGKTELAKSLIRHYQVGEFISGESSSVAGLLGGLTQTGSKWHINWGKIPLNNRRAVFIDEISGMSIDELALLSSTRSSGIAEITKIESYRTAAQTRKIWIGNPRKIGAVAKTMKEYGYGVVAVRELIGSLEDIRRFDFVLTAHSEEVDRKYYNAVEKKDTEPRLYTSERCHNLILWAWSRKAKQVAFSKKATDAILHYATEMGKRYFHGIPLVEAADQRLKLMRGAAAVAAMMYSTPDGETLKVEACHVQYFYAYLEHIFNKDSMKYGEWSDNEKAKRHLKDEKLVNAVIKPDIVQLLLEMDNFNLSSLIELTGWERATVKNMLAILSRNNGVQRVGTSFYRKSEALIDFLYRRKKGEVVYSVVGGQDEKEEMPF